LEQLELVAHVLGRRRGATARARDLLDGLGVGAVAGSLPGQLSGGERQRVGIGRALMAEPAVLLADEPTAALDPALAEQVSEVLDQVTRERRLATMIVTHDQAPLAYASEHVHLADGQLTRSESSTID
jgi:putative ABC transport system ATP-binding protein